MEKVYELSKTSENDELDGSLSYLNAKEKDFEKNIVIKYKIYQLQFQMIFKGNWFLQKAIDSYVA